MIVEVKEYNTSVEFPDNMSQAQIQEVLKREYPSKEQSWFAKYLPSVQRAGEIYKEEVSRGETAMKTMVEKPKGKNIIKGLAGALGYTMAPLTAFGKGIVQEPITGVLKKAGVPEYPAYVVGETVNLLVTGGLPYGKMVKGAQGVLEAQKITKEAQSIVPEITKVIPKLEEVAKPALKYVTPPTPELAAEMSAAGKLVKPVIQEDLQGQVAKAAIDILAKSLPDEKKRIGQQIIDLVHSDQLNWGDLPEIMAKHNITPQEFAQRLKDTYSAAGRSLGRLSLVSKQLNKVFKDNPEASKYFDALQKILPEPTTFDKLANAVYMVESTRRGFLVTQMATAVRNTISQTSRLNIGAVDDAMQAAIKVTVGGQGNLKQIGEGLDLFIAGANRLSKPARQRLTNIIESENADLARIKLFSTPVHEVSLGNKVASVLNTPNRMQEYFFRKIAFESKLTQLLERKGLDIKSIDPKSISVDDLKTAADYSLEMTFAAMPKSKVGQQFVRDWAGNPLMTALFNPFPRFAFGNALPFITNFSPISLMRAMNPKVVAKLANGNPDEFAKLASQGTIGTVMLGLANYIRNSDVGGEKWYEIRAGGKTIDTRAFAPLTTYLLVAEAMSHPEKLKTADWVQAAIGLNRIAGTGLVITDIIRSEKVENIARMVSRFAGEYLGSFSIPARTFQDIYAHFKPEEAIMRDIRGSELTGPTRKNIPIVSQGLPEAYSPTKSEPLRSEYPLTRQLSGLSIKTKDIMQKEVDRLGINMSKLYPKTGDPEADRMIVKNMGPVIEKIVPKILNKQYEKFEDPLKKIILSELFREVKQQARMKVAKENPEMYQKIIREGLGEDINDLMELRGLKEDIGFNQEYQQRKGEVPEVTPIAANVLKGLGTEKEIRKKLSLIPYIGKTIADQLFAPINPLSLATITPVYHGSPYKFGKFSNEKIGTGEGMQAFGYGHYISESQEVAKEYASRLSSNIGRYTPEYSYMGKPLTLKNFTNDQIKAIKYISAADGNKNNAKYYAGDYPKVVKEIDNIDPTKIKSWNKEGKIYEATLHKGKDPSQYNYLEWDKAVSDDFVNKINKQAEKEKLNWNFYKDKFKEAYGEKIVSPRTGQEAYKGLSGSLGGAQQASAFLKRAGIDGIKYPSGSLSGIKSDKYNYVVFDPADITIDKIGMRRK